VNKAEIQVFGFFISMLPTVTQIITEHFRILTVFVIVVLMVNH